MDLTPLQLVVVTAVVAAGFSSVLLVYRDYRRKKAVLIHHFEPGHEYGNFEWGRVARYARPFWKLAVWVMILSTIVSLIALVNPYLIKVLIDNVLLPKQFGLLWIVIALFLLVELVTTAIGITFSYYQMSLEQNFTLFVQKDLFRHMENLDMGFHQNARTGDLLFRIGNDVQQFEQLIENVSMTFGNIILGLGTFAVIFFLNWQVAVFSLIVLPLYSVIARRYKMETRRRQRALRQKGSTIISFLEERLSSIKLIKVFGREDDEYKAFSNRGRDLIESQLRFTLFNRGVNALMHYIGYLPVLFVLAFGGYEVLVGSMTVGGLVATYAYVQSLVGPFSNFGSFPIQVEQNIAAVERVFEVFDRTPTIVDGPDARALHRVEGKIEFDQVTFQYAGGKEVLHDISFAIEPGKTTALVGASGVGKTTIADLLCRFIEPTRGTIVLDGRPLEKIKISSLRSHIGVVSQGTPLYNLSIRDNIRYGRPEATDDEIVEASKLAEIHEFVNSLPRKYDNMVGERGTYLSEGQRQRVALARMFLKDPSVLILDEAMSSLDTASEEKIPRGLERIMQGRTVLVIAHRLSTVKNADQVLLLKEGRIVEQGAFGELMARKSEFYGLFKEQTELAKSPQPNTPKKE
jgi:ABC-type multidrug transport system fused ATPase/permease subunit